MKETVFISPYPEQKLRWLIGHRCKKMQLFQGYENGLFYGETKKYIYLEKRNSLICHLFKRVLRCRVEQDGDKIFVKCRFVFRKIAVAAAIIFFLIALHGNINVLLNTSVGEDTIFAQCVFLLFYAFLAGMIISGKLFFRKEEVETMEFMKELLISENNNSEEEF